MTLYDDLGNPTVYRGMGLTWGKGRQLVGAQSINFSASYTYNADGIRIGKSVTASHPLAGTLTTEHHYVLDGTRILAEIFNSGVMVFLYADESALTPRGIKYHRLSDDEGEWHYYYYDTDNFGNIVGIFCAASGRKIVTYQYDAWGNCTQIQESPYYLYDHSVMANNPFRYRGYYYDTETGLYYLQSRYYDPNTGRFLNADGYVNANGDLLGFNMYAYCGNNPVMYTDPAGEACKRCTLCCLEDECRHTDDNDMRTLQQQVHDSIVNDAIEEEKKAAKRVLSADYFAFYKGTLVIKVPFMKQSALSLGIIFMGSDVTDLETVRHEYGHIKQLEREGLTRYLIFTGVPSLLHAALKSTGICQIDDSEYYSLPWEYEADILGGVQNRDYTPYAKTKCQIYKWLTFSWRDMALS